MRRAETELCPDAVFRRDSLIFYPSVLAREILVALDLVLNGEKPRNTLATPAKDHQLKHSKPFGSFYVCLLLQILSRRVSRGKMQKIVTVEKWTTEFMLLFAVSWGSSWSTKQNHVYEPRDQVHFFVRVDRQDNYCLGAHGRSLHIYAEDAKREAFGSSLQNLENNKTSGYQSIKPRGI